MSAPILVKYWTIPIESPTGEAGPIPASHDEIERASRYVTEVHAKRYLRARQAIRRILSMETGAAPEDLNIVSALDGRPELSGGGTTVRFNISHSGDLILLGLCREAQIGVDVELIAPIEKNLVERFFSEAEQSALAQMSDRDWLRGFYRCWTRKEAFVKGMGRGLKLPLDKFDVSVEDRPELLTCQFAAVEDWALVTASVPDNYEGVIAVEARGRPVEVVRRPDAEAEPTAPFPA